VRVKRGYGALLDVRHVEDRAQSEILSKKNPAIRKKNKERGQKLVIVLEGVPAAWPRGLPGGGVCCALLRPSSAAVFLRLFTEQTLFSCGGGRAAAFGGGCFG